LPFLLKALALISKTDVNYKSAKNQRLLIEMALMQMAYLNAAPAPDAEKKNELEPVFETKAPEVTGHSVTASAVAEKIIKTADKPIVSFSELKIKAQFSLNEATKGNAPVISSGHNEVQAEIIENKPFTFEEIKKVVHEFAEKKNQAGNRQLFTTLTNSTLEANESRLKLTIHNEAQKETLQSVRQEFLDFVRKELSNNSIQFEVHIAEEIASAAKAYKPADKFKMLSEKNPALLELKKRFDLEIDY
jgi:DNA polymerase III subunit gamma/tau